MGDEFDAVDDVIGTGAPQRVGRFRFFLDGQRWEWSDEVARMHGYLPGSVVPTTELLMRHKHPDDRDYVAAVLERVARGEPFSSRHRIIDSHGHTHWVIVVADRMIDPNGVILGTTGFYIDVTDSLQSQLDTVFSEAAASRATIEQAKGVLMMVYKVSPNVAFDVLAWRSQETNTKVRELAGRFMAAVSQIDLPPETVTQIDNILLTIE